MKKLKSICRFVYRKIYNILHHNKLVSKGVKCKIINSKLNHNVLKNHGLGNQIIINDSSLLIKCSFYINGNNNKVYIGKNCSLLETEFYLEDNDNTIYIDNNTIICGKTHLACTEGKRITIGECCLFSNGIYIRTGDSHSIFHEGKRLNYAKDTNIGKHVWIAQNVTVLKGSNIGDGSVLGASSVVVGGTYDDNSLIVGNPGRIVKSNIVWKFERE